MTMRLTDVQGWVVEAKVKELPSGFGTKDVSQDPAVRAAHGALAEEDSYDSLIGKWLSRNSAALGIVKTGRKRDDNSEIWER